MSAPSIQRIKGETRCAVKLVAGVFQVIQDIGTLTVALVIATKVHGPQHVVTEAD